MTEPKDIIKHLVKVTKRIVKPLPSMPSTEGKPPISS